MNHIEKHKIPAVFALIYCLSLHALFRSEEQDQSEFFVIPMPSPTVLLAAPSTPKFVDLKVANFERFLINIMYLNRNDDLGNGRRDDSDPRHTPEDPINVGDSKE